MLGMLWVCVSNQTSRQMMQKTNLKHSETWAKVDGSNERKSFSGIGKTTLLVNGRRQNTSFISQSFPSWQNDDHLTSLFFQCYCFTPLRAGDQGVEDDPGVEKRSWEAAMVAFWVCRCYFGCMKMLKLSQCPTECATYVCFCTYTNCCTLYMYIYIYWYLHTHIPYMYPVNKWKILVVLIYVGWIIQPSVLGIMNWQFLEIQQKNQWKSTTILWVSWDGVRFFLWWLTSTT